MQIREANLDLTRILAYPAIPFDLTSREIATGNRAIAFQTDWIMHRERCHFRAVIFQIRDLWKL